MTRDDFIHPATALWQKALNAFPVPERKNQHDLADAVPVRARTVWERDGEEIKLGRVVATSRVRGHVPLVLVHWTGTEVRSATLGVWLAECDVERC